MLHNYDELVFYCFPPYLDKSVMLSGPQVLIVVFFYVISGYLYLTAVRMGVCTCVHLLWGE